MKREKKTAVFILCAPLFLLLVFAGALLMFGFILPPQYEETFLGEMKYKMKRLETTEGKRLILAGGSSVPFSIKSEMLEEVFPEYKAVDFGLYADLGLVIQLDWMTEALREGDVVILSPEQDPQALSCYFSGESVLQAADGAFGLLRRLPAKRWERVAAAFPVFAGKKCSYAIYGSPVPTDIYARTSFNDYGDISYQDRGYNIMAEAYDPNQPVSFSREVIAEDFITEMNLFAQKAQEKGAAVYYRFCPINKLALEKGVSAADIDSYYDYLAEQLSFPILGNPHRSILESGWFYDTNFHLNESGAMLFTAGLIEDLKLLWRNTSAARLTLPSMPERPTEAGKGDNSCQDCFTYKETPEGYVIAGLTEKGLAAPFLILPFSWQEKPITGIDPALFVGNTILTELTIQPNIGTLYDGMFSGCSRLRTLRLTGAPSQYTVGDSLMEGADFLICVPEDALNDYRRHYSWQKYDSWLTK